MQSNENTELKRGAWQEVGRGVGYQKVQQEKGGKKVLLARESKGF